ERKETFTTPSTLHDSDAGYRIIGYTRRSMNGSTFVKTEDGTFFDVKIEEDTIETPYSPAPEDITEGENHPSIYKTNILLSEPLRSVGDVKDRLFRDSDGLWKVERNVGEITFDGTESWRINRQNDDYLRVSDQIISSGTPSAGTVNIESNKLK